MIAIAGAILFAIVAVMTALAAGGAPIGEFTMGGQYKVLPKKMRILAGISLAVQIFAIIIILQAGGLLPLWFSGKVTKYITIFFAAYLSLNTVMNLSSNSKKEKYYATPLSAAAALCFWIAGFSL